MPMLMVKRATPPALTMHRMRRIRALTTEATTLKEAEPKLLIERECPLAVPKESAERGRGNGGNRKAWMLASAVATSVAIGAAFAYERPEYAREAFHVFSHTAKSFYGRCLDTGVAASVLLRSMRSVLSSANEEAKLGLKMRVAALIADLSGANSTRRLAIVSAGNGAVVDWLLDAVSDHSTSLSTQAEAARALSHLLKDSSTCDAVLARPHSMLHLFSFICSIRPRKKKLMAFQEGGEILKGKSMLVAAIMDIVTSNCDDNETDAFKPRLPVDADTRDIAAALQVVEEGGLDLDKSHDSEDDDNDDRKGRRGIGIKVIGGTAVVGLLQLSDVFMSGFSELFCLENLSWPYIHINQRDLGNQIMAGNAIMAYNFQRGGKVNDKILPVNTKTNSPKEHFEYHGLWDDLQSRDVAVPLAAWALSSWAKSSASNRAKMVELDSDGHALLTALMAPERSVKWHGALTTKSILNDHDLKTTDAVADWTPALLSIGYQASKVQDMPLARVAVSAFSLGIERDTKSQKVIRDKSFQQMREITKMTQRDQSIQEHMAKGLEILSTGESCLPLDESKQWSGILLQWVCRNQFGYGTKASATKVLSCILENYGPNVVTISQAWLTLLLTDLIDASKGANPRKGNGSSKEAKTNSTLQNQIIQSAAQISAQLASNVVQLSERVISTNNEDTFFKDLLTLEPFFEISKSKKKDRQSKVGTADVATATLKGIKALTELCSESQTYQKRIIDSGALYLLRHFMIGDDYEQLAATEAYDASRMLEKQDKGSSTVDPNSSNSSVRLPPTAHVRKHAARLVAILSLHKEASGVIENDSVWCRWLDECGEGLIRGCSDLKIRSYARATLLNLLHSKSTGNGHVNAASEISDTSPQQNICAHYEDMIYLINPESSSFKFQNFCERSRHYEKVSIADENLESVPVSHKSQSENNSNDEEFSEQHLINTTNENSSILSDAVSYPAVDVVFVHGLCGGPFNTWRVTDDKSSTTSKSGLVERIDQESGREGSCWPNEWLAADLPRARLLTVKYKTNLSQWSGATLPLEEVSCMLLKKLQAAGVGERPVVFVTHRSLSLSLSEMLCCMGGLVVKQMLFQASKDSESKLVNNTAGIVFYSCPHFGSKLADMPWKMGLVLRPAPSIGELRSGSPRLEELNSFIRRLHSKGALQVLSFSETKVTPLVEGYGGWAFRMEVVPLESAYPGFGELVVLEGTDHINSCKPIDRKDPAYTEVLHFLQKLQKNRMVS